MKAKGQSILESLCPGCAGTENPTSGLRSKIIGRAVSLLSDIQQALSQRGKTSGAFQIPHHQKIVDGLLDLISLEGIYPYLSPGVGVPIERRVKSVLQGGLVTRPSPTDEGSRRRGRVLLDHICHELYMIMNGDRTSLTSCLQERTLVDLIAGLSELAYAPTLQDEDTHTENDPRLQSLLDRFVAPISNA